jgi:hypothetical protein
MGENCTGESCNITVTYKDKITEDYDGVLNLSEFRWASISYDEGEEEFLLVHSNGSTPIYLPMVDSIEDR